MLRPAHCCCLLAGFALAASSCTTGDSKSGPSATPSRSTSRSGATPPSQRSSATSGKTSASALRQRAQTFWKAKQEENWETVFQFEDLTEHPDLDRAQFVQWSEQNDPFIILKHELARVETEGNLGWVEVRYTSRIRRYPDLDARDATTWQKWRFVNDNWFPIPLKKAGDYPDTPANRDLAAEKRLRERFEEACAARKERNWQRLFETFDPHDRSGAAVDGLKDIEDQVLYLECKLEWVEAIGDRAKMRVMYRRKANDPSLQKLAPMNMVESEEWVKVENEWYRDLKR